MAIEAWPGPMDGVFSPPFLAAAAELKLSFRWMTAFFRISENCPRLKFFRAFLADYPSVPELCGQLMGNSPDLLAAAALHMVEAGAHSLNLNFGCPASRVLSSGAGGALLKTPLLAAEITAVVAAAVPGVEVSVKIRSGFSDPEEMETLIPLLAASGAGKVFFHFRTVKEGYLPVEPEIRLARFRRAVELAGEIPVILNGDIGPVREAAGLLARVGGSGVMSARGWMRDPYWPRRVGGGEGLPSPEESRRLFLDSVEKHGASPGAMIGLRRMVFSAPS